MGENVRERDLVLAPNEFAFILDETKGHVIAYVGPHKTSLANTDRPVGYEQDVRRYRRCNLEEAITPYPFAEEGWYIVLENPAKDGEEQHPKSGPNTQPKLLQGRKINIPGPVTFPLWPGQVARVVQGHHLRSNQYLVVQVYNEEAARENWARAVMKPQKVGEGAPEAGEGTALEMPDLTLGKLLVIRGTEVSFYMPPTGIEVLPDDRGRYVRDAVTLERLEYCILLDEDGNKRFIEGPAVVFPEPTERFVDKQGSRKFKAIELNEISGLYIKVIAPYTDANGVERKVGEELFLTGAEQMIYFPRPEHALIRYGDQEIHYSVAIPAGQARYVLQRLTGEITLKHGPCMFLPDPRKEVLVRRILTPQECELLYPGNSEVLEFNLRMSSQAPPGGGPMRAKKAELMAAQVQAREEKAAEGLVGDDFVRHQSFTPPRTITLYGRLDGAVTINVWTGYAVQIVSKTGQRKVVVGPQTVTLEYDESLEPMELSTGTPKSDAHLLRTVYLRVLNNKVSDVISAETRDLCQVQLHLSYRVNFEGDPESWFNVENYVKFLTDHLRSMMRNRIKQLGIEEFHAQAIDIVRQTILGAPSPEGRPGRPFEENGMRVYDVDVLDVSIGDSAIHEMLVKAQHDTVRQTIELAQRARELETTKRVEAIKQETAEAEFETVKKTLALRLEAVARELDLSLGKIQSSAQSEEEELRLRLARQELISSVDQAELARIKARREQELELAQRLLAQRLEEMRAEVQSVVDKAQAVSPDLVAALQSFSDQQLAGKVAETMAPLAILGGKSVAEVFNTLLKDTPLEGAFKARVNGPQAALPEA